MENTQSHLLHVLHAVQFFHGFDVLRFSSVPPVRSSHVGIDKAMDL